MSENQAKKVYLGIGSNLGNKILNLEKAKFFLNNNLNIIIINVSRYYESESWPDKTKPFFLNIVLEIKTILSPEELFYIIKKIEKKLGRKKGPKNSPRVCDIDILDYDQSNITINLKNDKLIIPHPRLHKRNFVLMPLFEICKNWKHPYLRINLKKLINSLNVDNLKSIKML
tara:strand:+ start:231 stop:746 length:516 start_codon:yes stop_codon:yes gene_type:complete